MWVKLVDSIPPPAFGGGEKEKVSIVLRHNPFFDSLCSVRFTDRSDNN
ncbi:MAG: hypothetical protein LBR79_04490 [Oscillospiraceae bacterium]|nr:hypothetical protein [Oscillospiraceae bacterium]